MEQKTLKKYKDIEEPELDEEIKANIEQYKEQLQKEGRLFELKYKG